MPSPASPIAFTVGPLEIRWYAIFILAGIILGIAAASGVARRRGQNDSFLLDSAPAVVIAAVVGARLYYIALEWRYFADHPDRMFGLQLRGLTIHGALIAGIAWFWWLCRRHGASFLRWADTILVGVPIGQAIGRWGNWANQEAFGRPTDAPWGVAIDPLHRPPEFMTAEYFHPTFLYEAVCSLAIAAILAFAVLRYGSRAWWRDGYGLALYLILYGGVRLVIESMRTDSLYIGPWPAAYWLSGTLIVSGTALAMIVNAREVNRDNSE